MKRLETVFATCQHAARQTAWLAAAVYFWLAASPLAWAAKKKVEEAPPEKGYVMPYMIVLMMIGLGMMAVLRPSRRADKPEDKKKEDE